MSLQAKIKRFLLIIEKTKSTGYYPTVSEIIDFIEEHGISCSIRTFERDKDQLRNEFDIDIQFVKEYQGYHFFPNNSTNVDEFIQILTMVVTTETFVESLSDYKSISNFIHIDSNNIQLQGINQLKILLDATRNHRTIEFDHLNFWTKKMTHYKVCPYLLKEYQNRWYIVGTINDTDKVRTFGIDRIHELKTHANSFKVNESLNIKQRFEEIIGITYDVNQLEIVQLEFSKFQAEYIQTQPMHSSQYIEKKGDKIIATLQLIPNHELKQRILMYGANVKVLKPQWLKDEIAEEINLMIENYKK